MLSKSLAPHNRRLIERHHCHLMVDNEKQQTRGSSQLLLTLSPWCYRCVPASPLPFADYLLFLPGWTRTIRMSYTRPRVRGHINIDFTRAMSKSKIREFPFDFLLRPFLSHLPPPPSLIFFFISVGRQKNWIF